MEPYILKASTKGQLSMMDLVVSTMIFLVILSMFIWSWNEVQISVWGFEAVQDYRDRALQITDVLLHTAGEPTYWENVINLSEGISSIGFVSEANVLSLAKLERFKEMPYNVSKKILGLGKEGYYIEITDPGNHTQYSFGEERNAISSISRFAILGNETMIFNLRLFQE
jgi:hypothetical protein